MASAFYRKTAKDIIPIEHEVSRYLGYTKANPPDNTVHTMIQEAITQMGLVLRPQAVYDTFPLTHTGIQTLQFAGLKLDSKDLSYNLQNCTHIVIFAATIGAQVDTLIRRAVASDSAKAAILQATGAMYIESFCDDFNAMITQEQKNAGHKTHPRYSPGYGDVPLAVQKHIFSVLQCTRIGLSLMDTLIMSPEKSVTAFIGIE
ncbi:MAG: hypothetical protein K6E51_10995 [Treponema sp.]|nr:hypothetical protein [Treponema sp.]